MAFVFSVPTIGEVGKIANATKDCLLKHRILGTSAFGLNWVIDRDRDAYLFLIRAESREACLQTNFVLYYCGRFFDVRAKNWYTNEVCFYDFPPELEHQRIDIQNCFADAAPVFGHFGNVAEKAENALFIPVFGPDNWRLSPL